MKVSKLARILQNVLKIDGDMQVKQHLIERVGGHNDGPGYEMFRRTITKAKVREHKGKKYLEVG